MKHPILMMCFGIGLILCAKVLKKSRDTKDKKKGNWDSMEDLMNTAIEDLAGRWISFSNTLFINGVPLSENVDAFAQPLVEVFKNRYMTLYQLNGNIFWYTISESIIRSKTHQRDEVKLAIKDLSSEYD